MNISSNFQVIYAPDIIVAGRPFSVTLRINAPVCLEIDSPIVKPFNDTKLSFEHEDIVSLELICDRIINDFSFDIKSQEQCETINIFRCLEKPFDDNICVMFESSKDLFPVCSDFSSVILEAAKMRGSNNERVGLSLKDGLDKDTIELLQYLAYMNGTSNFYLNEQNDFYKFVLSHTRSGKYHTKIAFVLDKNQKSDSFAETMLSLCPTADIIDIKSSKIENYSTLCLIGDDCVDNDSANDLLAFVQTGGTLISSCSALRGEENKLSQYIFADKFKTISDSYCGIPIEICPNVKSDDIIATTDSGYPLAFIRRVGLGQIFFVNSLSSSTHNGVKPLYRAIISEISDNLKAEEKIYVTADKEITFTVYNQQDNARHIYLLSLDSLKKHTATLKLNKDKYKIDIPFKCMLKIVAKDNVAVWSEDENVEILLITANVVTLQGYGKTKIKYAKNGDILEREIDFTHKPIQAIQI